MLVIILFQGGLTFWAVGDLGQPDWDFGIVKHVPGESPYAVYPLNNPQHVKGMREEFVDERPREWFTAKDSKDGIR